MVCREEDILVSFSSPLGIPPDEPAAVSRSAGAEKSPVFGSQVGISTNSLAVDYGEPYIWNRFG